MTIKYIKSRKPRYRRFSFKIVSFDRASNPSHKINNSDMIILFFCSSFIVVVISIFVHIIVLNEKSITSCLPEGSERFVKKKKKI